MLPTKKAVSDAGGISKDFPIWRSMVVACDTENVVIWAWTVQKIMVVAHMGNILINIFTSSTSVRVDRRHFLSDVVSTRASVSFIAALSKNLHHKICRREGKKNTTVKKLKM